MSCNAHHNASRASWTSPHPRWMDATCSRTVTAPISESVAGNSPANSDHSRITSPASNCCAPRSVHCIASATVRAA